SGVEIFAAAPRLSVLAPVITARPERRADLADPGDLRGEISLVGVSFAYQPDAPLVLENLSLHVNPGEFVAVVGPSGCGKSTLLRLLLGFERPTMGAVLYDGQDLADLDPQAVRRQCGVVLQDGSLFPGSIRENICGAGNFSLEQVWAAARLAGIADDIKKLPMKMETLLPPGGGTLSGGQRQRILIARALIHRPRILLFDEATSALDNRTQDIVTASTRTLAATRLVIAHRLSTIVDADRVIVLDQGAVAQQGTFAELMSQREGLFYRLAARQLATTQPTGLPAIR
ncbi:MAG: ATP-binding cassette domain-containing protein, partial [Trebonia sp.]